MSYCLINHPEAGTIKEALMKPHGHLLQIRWVPGTEPGILAKGGQHSGLDEEQEEAQVPGHAARVSPASRILKDAQHVDGTYNQTGKMFHRCFFILIDITECFKNPKFQNEASSIFQEITLFLRKPL